MSLAVGRFGLFGTAPHEFSLWRVLAGALMAGYRFDRDFLDGATTDQGPTSEGIWPIIAGARRAIERIFVRWISTLEDDVRYGGMPGPAFRHMHYAITPVSTVAPEFRLRPSGTSRSVKHSSPVI